MDGVGLLSPSPPPATPLGLPILQPLSQCVECLCVCVSAFSEPIYMYKEVRGVVYSAKQISEMSVVHTMYDLWLTLACTWRKTQNI